MHGWAGRQVVLTYRRIWTGIVQAFSEEACRAPLHRGDGQQEGALLHRFDTVRDIPEKRHDLPDRELNNFFECAEADVTCQGLNRYRSGDLVLLETRPTAHH